MNRDLNGVREFAVWTTCRKRQNGSNSRGPEPVKSLAGLGNSKMASEA